MMIKFFLYIIKILFAIFAMLAAILPCLLYDKLKDIKIRPANNITQHYYLLAFLLFLLIIELTFLSICLLSIAVFNIYHYSYIILFHTLVFIIIKYLWNKGGLTYATLFLC